MKNYNFKFLSAPCGIGKTESLINSALNTTYSGKNVIIVAKSIQLCEEISQRIESKGKKATLIHSKQSCTREKIWSFKENKDTYRYKKLDPVRSRLVSELKRMGTASSKEGKILIITHISLLNYYDLFPKEFDKSNCDVYLDDPDSMIEGLRISFKDHPEMFTEYFNVIKGTEHINFTKIELNKKAVEDNRGKIDKIIKNKNSDEIFSLISPYYKLIQLGYKDAIDVYAVPRQIDAYINPEKETNFISLTSFVKPDFLDEFNKVTFVAAGFEYSLTKTVWESHYNVKWEESEMSEMLKNVINKAPLTINYVFQHTKWSKYLKQQDGVLETLHKIVLNDCTKDKVLFLGNKDERPPNPNWEICEYENRGINRYREHDTLYYTGAFNHIPEFYEIMYAMGFGNFVDQAIAGSHFYQTLSRTKIRDFYRNEENIPQTTVYVPSLTMAEDALIYFSNVTLNKINTPLAQELRQTVGDFTMSGLGKKKAKYIESSSMSTSQYRSARRSEKNKIESLLKMKKINVHKYEDETDEDVSEENVTERTCSLFAGVFQKTGLTVEEAPVMNDDFSNDFFCQMRLCLDRVATKKDDNYLLGLFTSKNHGRKIEDIGHVFGMAFDFDTPLARFKSKTFKECPGVYKKGGWFYVKDLTMYYELRSRKADIYNFTKINPINIEDLQSYVGKSVRIFGHSTFSGGNRRRFIMLFDRPVTVDEYKLMAKHLYYKITNAFPHHRLDEVMTNPNTIYYLPAKNLEKQQWSDEKGDEYFNVDLYLQYNITATQIPNRRYVKPEPKPKAKKVVKELHSSYDDVILPTIKSMKPGDRFKKSQRVVSLTAKLCPDMKERLLDDLVYIGGISEEKVKELIPWFDKMAGLY